MRIQIDGSASYDYGTLEHFRFNLSAPVNATLAKASGMISIVDNDTVAASPELFVRDVVIDEKAGTATFVVLLGGPGGVASASTVTVDYTVAGGNATSGSDYNANADALSGTLTFGPGEVVKTVTVAITDDATAEGLERINFVLGNAVNATIADANGVAVVGAGDAADAASPSLSVANKTVNESDGYIDLVVSLSAPSASNVSVAYATQKVTAADGGYDYDAVSGTLNFAPGETTKTVRIQIDGLASYDTPGVSETFRLNLSAAVNATIATPFATISIVDDDLAGQKVFSYGISDDVYTITLPSDVIVENVDGGTDLVNSSIDYTLGVNLENLTLTGAAINGTGNDADNVLIGNANANTLTGLGGNDTLDGMAGADTMIGGLGDDTYRVDNAGDVVTELAGQGTDNVLSSISYTLDAGNTLENLTLLGGANLNGTGNGVANILTGNSGSNSLDGKAGADTMFGGAGNDTYTVDSAGDAVTEVAGEGNADTVRSSINYTLGDELENLVLLGSADRSGTGNALDNTITGNSGNNSLNGMAGQDAMAGGAGNDTYTVDNSGDTATESIGEGTDLVQSGVSFTLGANVENLTLTGAGAINGTGNDSANVLTGNTGNNVLDGKAGADTMKGGKGNDTYIVDNAGDAVTELAGQGSDLVKVGIGYTLGAEVEKLALTGSANIDGTGNGLDNVLTGNSGNNVLDGGTGSDAMAGGAGNDTYVVDDLGDTVTESAGEGTELVRASVSFTLGANIENLTLTGGAAIDATGNELANVLTGNSGANTLDGKAGADAMSGGAGGDTYVVDNAGDTVTESEAGVTDLVQSSVTFALGANIENLTLTGTAAINGTGNELSNSLTGNSKANLLDGGSGTDAMAGGSGNDTYTVDNAGDTVTENVGEGADLVQSSVSFTLGANVENLTLTGAAAIDATGNELANALTGNTGANTLDGLAGADAMSGGGGNDTYIVDNVGDTVAESAGGGTGDLVQASVSFTLGAEVEKLTLTGSAAINGTGNGLANVLTGNTGNNALDGKAGADTMKGGKGNDTYVVDNAGDAITELAGQGSDLVKASIGYTLGAEVEKLTLTGSANIDGTGNGLANVLTGNTGSNVLDGKAGADTMKGGKGNDTYVVDDLGDTVTESAGEGTDLVQSSLSFVLGANVENLTLTGAAAIDATGNELANVLTGNSGANTLDGKAGADAMSGGAGGDTYIVDNTGDTVNESESGVTDLVQSRVSFTLGANLENLTLTGAAAINATGNELDNVLIGNAGANTLDGKAGADAMSAGAGGDTYIVDDAGDTVTETEAGVTDLVQSSVSFTLGANVENLTLTGAAAIDGTGNELANLLTGNAGANTLDGMAGADAMSGGGGNDIYVVDNLGDTVSEHLNEGSDLVQSSVTFTLGADIEKLTLTGSAAIDGTGNNGKNTLIGNTAANTLDGKGGADAMKGGKGNDTYFVDHAGDVVTELAGQGTADQVRSKITVTLAAEVENLRLTGTDAIDGTGNTLDNTLYGNAAANRFTGDAGHDTFVIDGLLASDTITDFASGTDRLQVSMAAIPVGDGDKLVEGAVVSAGPGGFDASAEFVVMTSDIAGVIDATAASSAIGSAFSAYAVGSKALFMVDNGTDSALYYFSALDADAAVEANELTLLATLQGTASTATSDLIFGA
ncbi:MAG: hypothetical protein IPG91_13485 [Ideonella sp.]|nr:hypothetical protein [Ideonella sp.]